MKIIHQEQTQKFKNGENCTAFEYPSEEKDSNGAVIELVGRYPDKGRAMNTQSKMLVYVIDGVGKIVVESEVVELKKGDVVSVESGEKYFWDGHLTLFIASTPAWSPDQYQEVE